MPAFKQTLTAKRERAAAMFPILQATYPDAHCTLNFRNAWELLVGTILAAQCTDERVNQTTKDLFAQYPAPVDYLNAPLAAIEAAIRPCGFYRNKAKNLRETARQVVEEHGGQVPGTMEELVALAGVGRKTANVILGECFNTPGVIVDTHCTRLTNRWGFTGNRDARKIEQDLMKVWPRETWTLFSHYTVWHGRAVCTARGPRCSVCPVRALCPFPETREGKKLAR